MFRRILALFLLMLSIVAHALPGPPASLPSSIPSSVPSSIPSSVPPNIPTNLPQNLPANVPSGLPDHIPSDWSSHASNVDPNAIHIDFSQMTDSLHHIQDAALNVSNNFHELFAHLSHYFSEISVFFTSASATATGVIGSIKAIGAGIVAFATSSTGIGILIGAGVLVIGGGSYGCYRYYKKRKRKKAEREANARNWDYILALYGSDPIDENPGSRSNTDEVRPALEENQKKTCSKRRWCAFFRGKRVTSQEGVQVARQAISNPPSPN